MEIDRNLLVTFLLLIYTSDVFSNPLYENYSLNPQERLSQSVQQRQYDSLHRHTRSLNEGFGPGHYKLIRQAQLKIVPIYDNGLGSYGNVFPSPILQPDPTVIVNVPNNDVSRYGTSRYGVPVNPYGVGMSSSPTVVVNVPDEYDNTYGGTYGTNVLGARRRL